MDVVQGTLVAARAALLQQEGTQAPTATLHLQAQLPALAALPQQAAPAAAAPLEAPPVPSPRVGPALAEARAQQAAPLRGASVQVRAHVLMMLACSNGPAFDHSIATLICGLYRLVCISPGDVSGVQRDGE